MSPAQHRLKIALSVVAVTLLIVALWLGSGWRAFSHADTYRRIAADNALAPGMTTVLVGALAKHVPPSTDASEIPFADVLTALSSKDRQTIAAQIVDAGWLRTQTDKSINLLFRWLGGDNPALDTQYDLTEVVARLRGTAGDGLVTTILGRLPACTTAQTLALRAERQGTSTAPPPLCLPAVLQRPTVRQALATAVSDFAAALDTLKPTFHNALTNVLRASGSTSPENALVDLRLMINLNSRLVSMVYLLAFGVVALMVAVGVRSAESFAVSVGRVSLIAGVVGFALAWLAPVILGPRLREMITAAISAPAFQTLTPTLTQDALEALFAFFMRGVIGQALVLAVIGLALLVGAAVARRRARRALVQPAPIP